jgi:hypothetical protein
MANVGRSMDGVVGASGSLIPEPIGNALHLPSAEWSFVLTITFLQ